MARRPALVKKRVKVARATKSETYLVNSKYMGDEPVASKEFTDLDFMKALNWYSMMCTVDDARTYLKDYLKAKGRSEDIKQLSKVSDTWIPTTVAWVARLELRGFKVPEASLASMQSRLQAALDRFDGVETDTPAEVENRAPKPSVQSRMREKADDLIGEIEALIDCDEEFSLYDWLQANQVPAAYMSMIVAHYAPWLDELIEAHEEPDEQLKEAYRGYTKKQIRDRIAFFSSMMEEVERYGSNTKKTRKPRKPRTVSVEKKLKHFRYQKENNEFKLASVNPEKIIGAQELWTFNTKYKIVTVFRAIDRGGLQIKRSSIIGYDENNSYSKGAGRKAEAVVDKIQKGGKIVLRKLMDELKTDKPLQERINENTIIMRIV